MIGIGRFLTVISLMLIVMVYINVHTDYIVPVKRPFTEFPRSLKGWRITGEAEFSRDVLDVLRPTDYLYRRYSDDAGHRISLYVGFHNGDKGAGEIHSPKHCLPGSGWYLVSSSKSVLRVDNGSINLVRAIYLKGESKELFLYWFQVRDKTLADEYSLKLAEIRGAFLQRRRDSSFIRVSIPFDQDESSAVRAAEQFVRDFTPKIREFLPS